MVINSGINFASDLELCLSLIHGPFLCLNQQHSSHESFSQLVKTVYSQLGC